jgi:hypothetical protein
MLAVEFGQIVHVYHDDLKSFQQSRCLRFKSKYLHTQQNVTIGPNNRAAHSKPQIGTTCLPPKACVLQ